MSEPTGIDLARQILNAARAEARKRGAQPARKRPAARARRTRGDGREPVKLGTAIDELAERFGWQKPSAGARVVISWSEIAPDLAHLAAAERFDATTRTLHLRPASPAAATHLRLHAAGLPDRINAHTGAATVQAVRVLPPGPAPARPADMPAPAAAAEQAPPLTRQTASAGYHRALTAHQVAHTEPTDPMPPAVQAAIADQDQALLASREPEQAFADARELLEDLHQRAAAASDPRARALARTRTEKAGHTAAPLPPPAARTA